MRWYADNSELNGIRDAKIPDILLFGGIIVRKDVEGLLQEKVETVKAKYGNRRAPVKWNFKDLKNLYNQQGMLVLYNKLLPSSREWRAEIFDAIKDIDFCILISVLQSHSPDRKTIKNNKEDLTRYVFSNSLMRFGLHVKEMGALRPDVVLDWPDKGCSRPFDVEYAAAYNLGRTKDKSVRYQCGSLRKLGFRDHAVYGNMHHSTLLQLSDLVVGATREFVECALGKKPSGQGIDCLKQVKNRLRGYPEKIFGRGINVGGGDKEFKQKIQQGIRDHLLRA